MHHRIFIQAALAAALLLLSHVNMSAQMTAHNLGTSGSSPDSVVAAVAEANGLLLVPAGKLPRHGTYWRVMNEGSFLLPMPFRPEDPKSTPIFSLGAEGQFLVDATGGALPQPTKQQAVRGVTSTDLVKAQIKAIQDLIAQVQEVQLNTELGALPGVTSEIMLMGMGPMGLGYSTNDLWIEVLGVDIISQYAFLRLHGTIDGDNYQITSTTNLMQPTTEWALGPIMTGATDTNQTDFNYLPIADNAMMFFRAHRANPVLTVSAGQNTVEPSGADPGQPGIFYVNGYGLTNDLTVYYRAGGSAQSGVDYSNLGGAVTLTNVSGSGSAEIKVQPIADNLLEGQETLTLTLLQTNQFLISPNSSSATIAVEDSSTTVIILPGAYAVEPNGPPGVPAQAGYYSLYRSDERNIYTNALDVFYQVSGTASNGVDYTLLTGVFHFAPDINATNLEVKPLTDNLTEGLETVTVTLIPTNTYLTDSNNLSAVVTIEDTTTTVKIGLIDAESIEPNGPPGVAAKPGSFWVSRTDIRGLYTNSMNVFYQVSGTASNGVDYTLLSGVLQFAPDISYTNLDVNPLADNILEGMETVVVTLIPTSGYMIDTNFASGEAFTTDSSIKVKLLANSGGAIEPSGPPGIAARPASFLISRTDTRAVFPAMDVFYQVTGTASNSVDYALLNGAFHFVDGVSSSNLVVTPLNDELLEGLESVTVTLVTSNHYFLDTNFLSGTVTINDSSTTVSLVFSSFFPAVEADGPPGAPARPGIFTLSRTDTTSKYPDMDVAYQVTGTASNGVDYVFMNGVFHFATNFLSTNFFVTPLADSVLEGAETVTLTLTPAAHYFISTNSFTGTVSILDSSTTVGISAGTNATEPYPGGSIPVQTGNFVLTRSDIRGIYTNMTVFYQVSGTASNGVDYPTLTGNVTFAPNRTTTNIYIQPLADFLIEGDETVTMTLLATNGYYLTNTALTITIRDKTNMFAPVISLNVPIGIDYNARSNCLIASCNFSYGGEPNIFAAIYTNIVVSNSVVVTNTLIANWSGLHGLNDEIKLATVKANAGGFTNGDMFFSSGTNVGWLSADGTRSNLNWCILTNQVVTNSLALRGSLYVDQTGLFSNNLIVVTSPGNGVSGVPKGVWRVDAQGHPTLLTNLNTPHLEGVITLTNDVQKWGPWAGKIITGDEDKSPVPVIYAIDTNGAVVSYDTTSLISGGIHPEDFDIIPPNQDLYACDPNNSQIVKLSSHYLTNYVGDLLITDAGESFFPSAGNLFIVHWNAAATNFVTVSIPYKRPTDGAVAQLEHVTFAPINLVPTP